MEEHRLCSFRQLDRLREHIAYASEHTAYYRRTFREAGVGPERLTSYADLARFPLMTKADVIGDQKGSYPFGSMLAVSSGELRRIHCSGGPVFLALTERDIEATVKTYAEGLAVQGLGKGDILDIASSFHWVVAGTLLEAAARRVGAAAIPGGPGTSALRLQVLRQAGVTALQAFTPYAETLGAMLQEQGIDPNRDLRVRLVSIGGELRMAAAKERLSRLWGNAAVRESYGTGETGMVAAECLEAGDGMHISEDFVVEIIDPETGQPVPPERGGEIVITELFREAQPFIRLRTGDITEGIDFTPCRCGRSTPRLKRIVGRRSSVLRVRGLFVYPEQIQAVVANHTEFRRCQVVADRQGVQDTLTVRLEQSVEGITEDLRPVLVKELKDAIGLSCQIEVLPPGTFAENEPMCVDRRQF
ncbi:MAG: phenylacetate--CoA ligase family protein [Anaerolineae bacterium]